MRPKILVVRQMSWRATIPQLLVLASLIEASAFLFGRQYGILSLGFGAAAYLSYSYASRWVLLRHHRQGRQHTQRGNYADAIKAFERSYQFFTRHLWLDRWRSLTMMTPALQTYREMALVNMAFCCAHLGDINQAKVMYQRTLEEFPGNTVARSGLAFLENLEATF